MYYNKDAFRRLGWILKARCNWDELVAAGKKLTKKSGDNVDQWGAMIRPRAILIGCSVRWQCRTANPYEW